MIIWDGVGVERAAAMGRRSAAESTAFGPMAIVAIEQHYPETRRLVHDPLAIWMLPPWVRLLVRACGWAPARELLIRATEPQAPGVWGGILCRKRYADERVVGAIDGGIRQLVVLGAGLDTRACRIAAPAEVPAYELDQPGNSAYKRERLLAYYGRIPEHVTLIPHDFEAGDLGEALRTRGFRLDQRAVFVWEGVTQYLTEPAVHATLAFLAKAAQGSRLLFTYAPADFIDGTKMYRAEKLYQAFVVKRRIWHFGIDPAAVDGLLREYGWTEREQAGAAEYASRYLEPAGRSLSVMTIERFVDAVKL